MAADARLLGPIDQRKALRLLLFVGVVLAAAAIDLTNTALGRALLPAFGATIGVNGGIAARILIGIVLGVLALLNLLVLTLLQFRWQVLVMWVELLILFLAFFTSFDLSYPFIWSRLIFLVSALNLRCGISNLRWMRMRNSSVGIWTRIATKKWWCAGCPWEAMSPSLLPRCFPIESAVSGSFPRRPRLIRLKPGRAEKI